MRIATYANARTALEARKGVAPAFMTGASHDSHAGRPCCRTAALHRLVADVVSSPHHRVPVDLRHARLTLMAGHLPPRPHAAGLLRQTTQC